MSTFVGYAASEAAYLGPDTHANRPSAAITPNETLYVCTTHNMIERVEHGAWVDWATMSDPTAIPKAIVDAKGDLLAASADNIVARLPVGSDGQALIADASQALGVKWAAVAGALPADTVVAAATRIISNVLAAGDTQPAWRVLGSGEFDWGPGGSVATDTRLFRSGAGILTTDAGLWLRGGGGHALAIFANLTDANSVLFVSPTTGQLNWGPGGAVATDTNLYRSSAGVLSTDGSFVANGGVYYAQAQVAGNAVFRATASGDTQYPFVIDNRGGFAWGSGAAAADLAITRAVINGNPYFKISPGNFTIGTLTDLTPGATVGAGLTMGVGGGISAVRSAVAFQFNARLQTDTQVRYQFDTNGLQQWGPGGTTAPDTSLSRNSAKLLQTNGGMLAGSAGTYGFLSQTDQAGFYNNPPNVGGSNFALLSQAQGAANPAFYISGIGTMAWGAGGTSAVDTGLYRTGANQLGTDGEFWIGRSASGSRLLFGPADVYLYRVTTPTQLASDAPIVSTQGGGASSTVRVGIGFDVGSTPTGSTYTSLYWDAANTRAVLGCLNQGTAWRDILLGRGGQVLVNKIAFGTSDANFDAAFSRQGAGVIRALSSDLYVDKTLATNWGTSGQVFFPPYANATIEFSPSRDTNLYRASTGVLKTDGYLNVGGRIIANQGLSTQIDLDNDGKIYFGSATDLALARSAAGFLNITGASPFYGSLQLGSSGGNGGFIEFLPRTAAGAAAAGYGRLMMVTGGGGKSELRVYWSTGSSTLLATEP